MLDKVKADSMVSTVTNSFLSVRTLTEKLCQPLEIEDYNLQAMAETSPVKWHLAHTTWFFETFILKPFEAQFKPFQPQYEYLFNSYYNAIGEQFSRPDRHLLSRPTVKEVLQYRKLITDRVVELLSDASQKSNVATKILELVTLGIHHEQQHQELLLTDLKYNLYQNPLLPAYLPQRQSQQSSQLSPVIWLKYEGGVTDIGQQGAEAFSHDSFYYNSFYYDNESPQHKHYIEPFELSHRLITNGEFLDFIESGGYDSPEFWLSDGWTKKCEENWGAPLYWFKKDGAWYHYTLRGVLPLDLNQAVTHVSYYEADAFASWAGARLPTEQEWESVARHVPVDGNFLGSGHYRPLSARSISATNESDIQQIFGDVWEWASSAYSPYPGYSPLKGAVGEYNGKFMANQFVLRGGSCVTSQNHIRATYRNFFYPEARWQFSGFRLARSL